MKPPRPSKGGTGMMFKIPRKGLTPTSQLPLLVPKGEMGEKKKMSGGLKILGYIYIDVFTPRSCNLLGTSADSLLI
jgi:hypothetical protein